MLEILEEKVISTDEKQKSENFNKDALVFSFSNEQSNLNSNMNKPKENYYFEDRYQDIQVLLLCVNNDSFKLSKNTYDLELCGKTMKDWVKNSVADFCIKEVEIDSKQDFFPVVKQNLDMSKKYTLVLFSDAPLLQYKTVQEIIEYFIIKSLSTLKFSRGYMFDTEYLNTIDKLLNPQIQYFNEEDFITCYNLKQLALINDILRNRIISFHQKNGVMFLDSTTTFIDADVTISNDTVIYPNNKIFGNTIIEGGTTLLSNNLIERSVIMNNSKIEGSVIKDSIIGKNCVVENFCAVKNKSYIKDNSKLCGYNVVDSKIIDENTILAVGEKRL